MIDLERARKRIAKKYEERRRRLEARRTALLQKIELAAAEFATEFSAVTEIIVFGSLVRPGYFTELSDVDIAVRDLPNAQYWKAILWWEKHLEFEDIDLVRIEDASAGIRKYITKGKTVHEE